jgi:hypothetical protein
MKIMVQWVQTKKKHSQSETPNEDPSHNWTTISKNCQLELLPEIKIWRLWIVLFKGEELNLIMDAQLEIAQLLHLYLVQLFPF